MANKKNSAQSDIYKQMYEKQLEKFKNMDKDINDDDNDNLRFYTEEELAAIEQAKRDAARQAYQDAYLEQYNQSQKQYRRSARSPQQYRQVKSSSQRYAKAARKKHESEQIEFGRKNSYTNSKKGRKAMRGSSAIAGVFRGLLLIILVVLILFQLLIFRYINMVKSVDTDHRLYTDAAMSDSKVSNILLIGSDTRNEEERGRTDSMIMLSINSETKEMTMTSFMRDCWVEIPEHGYAKLNAAYAYGGPELLMDTIAYNFDVEVDKYVYVSFFSFIDIVDAAGGIELDISDEEALGMTDPMAEQNKYLGNKKGTDYLTKGGKGMTVNGNQALAYARLRYVGNADFERTERQRTVITQIIAKAKTLNPLDLDKFLKVSASELTTNMSKSEMYVMFYKLLFSMKYEMKQLRIPEEGAYYYGNHDGQSTLDLDFDKCKKTILENVYN